jgi:predicted ATPase/transcriptional regulator with XRE-family HTH domain
MESTMTESYSFGAWVRKRRRALDLTQDALALRVGCAVSMVRKTELDERRPSKQLAGLLAAALELPAGERAAFLKAARAELASDKLAAPEVAPSSVPQTPRASQLPSPPTRLIGREHNLAQLHAIAARPGVRLLTLTGAGGSGKTRLTLQLAAELADRHSDGAVFVDLAPLQSAEQVVPAIAQPLGVREMVGTTLQARLCEYLASKQHLLLLDNFEHLLDAAPVVAELLRSAPRLMVLVTSRVALRLSGEHEYPVPPLDVPPQEPRTKNQEPAGAGQGAVLTRELSQYPAVQLFVARAQAAQPSFALTEANAPAVGEICRRLDGLPLAIELAAARVKLLPPDALLARLGDRLGLLTSGARDLPARQQTLRSAIDWSYNLLSTDEQRLFVRLGVFVGGWTLEAAEAVASELRIENAELRNTPYEKTSLNSQFSMLNSLQALVDHSLVRQEEGPDGAPRFGMLELLREYALGRLHYAGEEQTVRHRHATYLLELIEVDGPLLSGPHHPTALEQLEAELPNVRAAYAWFEQIGDYDLALRLAVMLFPFWQEREHHGEGRALLRSALSRPDAGPPIMRARALSALGRLSREESTHWPETVAALEESLAIFRSLDDLIGSANALDYLHLVASAQGDLQQALALEEACLQDCRAAQNPEITAWALQNLAGLVFLHGDDAQGNILLDESLALFDELNYPPSGRAWALSVRAWAVYRRGDIPQAVAILSESVALLRRGRPTSHLAYGLYQLGRALSQAGDFARAMDTLQECLAVLRSVGEADDPPDVLCILGMVALAGGDHVAARAYLQECRALSYNTGAIWDVANALLGEGHVAFAEHNVADALKCYQEALRCFASLPSWDDRRRKTGLAACLASLAGAAAATAPAVAAWLSGASAAVRATVEPATLKLFDESYILMGNRPANDTALANVRTTLGEAAFDAAWAAGQALTLDQAVAEALALAEPPAA